MLRGRHRRPRSAAIAGPVALIAALALLALTGCEAVQQRSASNGLSISPTQAASVEASSGSGIPAHLATLPATDSAGRTPDQAVRELIKTANAKQWERLYSMYATPTPSIEVAMREWAEAQEVYEGFEVLETRVTSPDTAFVRVAYTVIENPMSRVSPNSVRVGPPGEWWPLHRVDEVWKVQWMPRQ